MPFVPLDQVSSGTQRQRSGFIPLSEIGDEQPAEDAKPQRGFIPLDAAEPERPSVLKTVLLENPGTAILETGTNLLSQGVALPVAGLAGIGTAAAKAMGLTDQEPADVVHAVGGALTYQPRGEFGKAATGIVMAPFEALAKVGTAAGDKVLDATGSPVAATAVDTLINAAPMAIAPAAKGAKAAREKFSNNRSKANEQATETASQPAAAEQAGQQPEVATRSQAVRQDARGAGTEEVAAPRGFIPLSEVNDGATVQAGAQRVVRDAPPLSGTDVQGFQPLRRGGNNGLPGVDGELRAVPQGHGTGADAAALAGAVEGAGELRARELLLDDTAASRAAPDLLQAGEYQRPGGDGSRGGAINRSEPRNGVAPGGDGYTGAGTPQRCNASREAAEA